MHRCLGIQCDSIAFSFRILAKITLTHIAASQKRLERRTRQRLQWYLQCKFPAATSRQPLTYCITCLSSFGLPVGNGKQLSAASNFSRASTTRAHARSTASGNPRPYFKAKTCTMLSYWLSRYFRSRHYRRNCETRAHYLLDKGNYIVDSGKTRDR